MLTLILPSQLAAQRQRKLEELQEKWVSTVPSTAEAGEGGAVGGKRKRAAGGGSSRGKKSKGVDSEEEVADSTNDVRVILYFYNHYFFYTIVRCDLPSRWRRPNGPSRCLATCLAVQTKRTILQ
jgi:hypothetical protein